MAAKKTRRKRTTAVRRRRTKKSAGSDRLTNFFVPLVLMIGIVGCIGFIAFMGLRSVSASSFFNVDEISVAGNSRVSAKRIEAIVNREASAGLWDTDLERIRVELERISYIRHASVSRVMPDTIRVRVEERRPVAVARIDDELKELDADGKILGPVPQSVRRNHMLVLIGWDESIDEKARRDNEDRLRIYSQLKSEWSRYELINRVVSVDLESTRNVEAHVMDSGEKVTLSLGNEEFVDRLKEGLKLSAGAGKRVSRVELDNTSPVIVYRDVR